MFYDDVPAAGFSLLNSPSLCKITIIGVHLCPQMINTFKVIYPESICQFTMLQYACNLLVK